MFILILYLNINDQIFENFIRNCVIKLLLFFKVDLQVDLYFSVLLLFRILFLDLFLDYFISYLRKFFCDYNLVWFKVYLFYFFR